MKFKSCGRGLFGTKTFDCISFEEVLPVLVKTTLNFKLTLFVEYKIAIGRLFLFDKKIRYQKDKQI